MFLVYEHSYQNLKQVILSLLTLSSHYYNLAGENTGFLASPVIILSSVAHVVTGSSHVVTQWEMEMPRQISGEHERGRHRQIKYRGGLAQSGRIEIDAVDTSLAQALSMYIDSSVRFGSAADQQAAWHLENIAVHALFKRVMASRRRQGHTLTDPDQLALELRERVASRIYYLQMIQMHPSASAADKRRFAMGPVLHVPDPLDWDDDPDVQMINDPDETAFDFNPEDYDDEA